jgi:hypothetical protein
MICTYKHDNHIFDYNDPWSQILENCAGEIQYTGHCILGATPAQIAFARDLLLELSYTENYNELKTIQIETYLNV